METSRVDVLVIGAGPVGLAIASLLKMQNIDVRVIEKNSETTPYSKAIGVHSRILEGMHALGITESLVSQGHPMHNFRLSENGMPIMDASFSGIGSAYEFVLGLPQRITEKTLHEKFSSLGGAVNWKSKIIEITDCGNTHSSNSPAEVVIEREDKSLERIKCKWLIGADGSRSSVREMANIEFPGGSYGNAFILGDVRIDWEGEKNLLQFFLSGKGYLLVIPMPEGMHRIIAQTDKRYEDFQVENKQETTLEELQNIVDENGPGGIRVHSPDWLTSAPFYHRCAEAVQKERVLLAGDAFHLFSPLGAQGLNTGFQDVFNLSWKIAFVENGWAEPSLIESYAIERNAIASLIAQVTSKTTKYITAKAPHERVIRQFGTKLLNKTKKVQEDLPRLMAGIMQKYDEESPLVGHSGSITLKAGHRFPHAWVPEGSGYVPIAKKIHGQDFTAVLLTRRLTEKALNNVIDYSRSDLPAMPYLNVMVISREIEALSTPRVQGLEYLEDRLGTLSELCGNSDSALILVRPDGYCAFTENGWPLESISRYFSSIGMKQYDLSNVDVA